MTQTNPDDLLLRRLRQLRQKHAQEQAHFAHLQRDRRRVRYLAILVVGAAPAGWLWGLEMALWTGMGALSIVAIAAYITGVHEREYLWKIDDLQQQIAAAEAAQMEAEQ